MILVCLILVSIPQVSPSRTPAVPLTQWFFQPGTDIGPEDAGTLPGTPCEGPWEVGDQRGVCWTRLTLDAVDPGLWVGLLGTLQVSSVTVNGQSIPTETDETTGLTRCRLFAETLIAGANTLAIRTPCGTTRPASGTGSPRGPLVLLPPEIGRWVTDRLGALPVDSVAGNFSIRCAEGPSGGVLSWIFANARDGGGFRPLALAGLSFERADGDGIRTRLATEEMESQRLTEAPPQSFSTCRDRRLGDLTFTVATTAPVALGDVGFSAIPALTTSITIATRSRKPIPVDTRLRLLPLAGGPLSYTTLGAFTVAHNASVAVAMSAARPVTPSTALAEMVSSQEAFQPERALRQVQIDLVIIALDPPPTGIDPTLASNHDWKGILRWTLDQAPQRRQALRAFRGAIPITGSRSLAVALTAAVADCWRTVERDRSGRLQSTLAGDRAGPDAFFTSWIHLLLFPELEERALLAARDGGPRDDRQGVLARSFSILRIHRLVAWDPELAPPAKWLETTQAQCEGLLALDADGDGRPDERPLHPAAAFAYLAALRETAAMAERQGAADAAARLMAAHDKAAMAIHADCAQGGMWNGSGYRSLPAGAEGSRSQAMGVVLGEIPRERVAAVLEEAVAASAEQDPLASAFGPHLDPLLAWALFDGGQADRALELLEAWAERAHSGAGASPVALAALMFGDLGLHRESGSEWLLAPARDLFGTPARRFHIPEGNLNLGFTGTRPGTRRIRVSGQLDRDLRLTIRLPENDRTLGVDLESGERVHTTLPID